eukprot:COSAG06_NODE_2312_length_7100_cov_7.782609_7_plen_95_part_00
MCVCGQVFAHMTEQGIHDAVAMVDRNSDGHLSKSGNSYCLSETTAPCAIQQHNTTQHNTTQDKTMQDNTTQCKTTARLLTRISLPCPAGWLRRV